MAEVYRQIMDLKKDAAKKEAERKEMADVIEQEDLIPIKGRRPHRLGDVYVRPQLDGKRLPGELEIHTNGIRYQSIKSDNSFSKWNFIVHVDHCIQLVLSFPDVLFSNVKHLFFQPCDNELLVLIHVHFKNPILIGKKKTKVCKWTMEWWWMTVLMLYV